MNPIIVDGYNLLFLVGSPGGDLQSQRNVLIDSLASFSTALNLNIILVFDSQFQKGESTLADQGNLRIIYTNQGETADDHIITLIHSIKNPNTTTVVTSDKRLACKARALHTKTQDVKSFFENIKQRASKKVQPRPPQEAPPPPPPKKAIKPKEKCEDYYLRQFMLSYEESASEPTKPSSSPSKNKTKKSPKPPVIESDMARWLRLFNENQ